MGNLRIINYFLRVVAARSNPINRRVQGSEFPFPLPTSANLDLMQILLGNLPNVEIMII